MPEFEYRPRSYLHFDAPPSRETAEELATSPDRVARHSFYPFLGFTIETPRITKGADGHILKGADGKPLREPKKRPIKLAAHLDAAICSHYARILSEAYEADVLRTGIGDNVTAFRKLTGANRNNIDFADEAFEFIQSNRPCVAIGLDVRKFFDNLDHRVLKARWARTLRVDRLPPDHFALFKYLTRFKWIDRDRALEAVGIDRWETRGKGPKLRRICSASDFRSKVCKPELLWSNPQEGRGIPQGSPISALLSNVYMFEFDRIMKNAVSASLGMYRRYCDDILLVVPPSMVQTVERIAAEEIRKLGLDLNEEKTARVRFSEEPKSRAIDNEVLQYLGFDFNGVQKLIRSSSLVRYYGKMRRGVRFAKINCRAANKKLRKRGLPTTELRTRKLKVRYSYLIRRKLRLKSGESKHCKKNFITYAIDAAERMNAPEIKRQIKNHWKKLNEEIAKPLKPSKETDRD